MEQGSLQIKNGSRVAIIGGGPAGAFFALYLAHYARERNIHPEVTIYHARDFNRLGPKGCKGCAGILSMALLQNIAELRLKIPGEIIQSKIEQYTVHSPYTSISIRNPETDVMIASIYRGGGPLHSALKTPVSFDGWLLNQAHQRGIAIVSRPVTGIDLGLESRVEVIGVPQPCDLVVMASGVCSRTVPIRGIDYIPPRTRMMTQDELYLGYEEVHSTIGNTAHVFLIPHSGIIFGTLVPKGPFVNVSVLSHRGHKVSVRDFLNHELVRKILPDKYEHSCGCRPRIMFDPGQNYFADRFVTIGDAAITKLYKDGIGSSLLAARAAAHTAIYHGISEKDFERHYRPFCRKMDRDNKWGKFLFGINDRAKNSRTFLLAQHRLVGDEQDNPAGRQPYTKVVWGLFTGNYSYGRMLQMAFGPLALSRLSLALLAEWVRFITHRQVGYPRKLYVGSRKVLILGSGFGGTYTLRHLVPRLNRNENVVTTMISEENYFLFSPLLHEVAMGGIETRHISYPIRRLHWRDRFNFVQARVGRIDLAAQMVQTTKGTFEYDYLILSLGSQVDMSEVNTDEEMVFTLKNLRDAVRMRNHIIKLFEQASAETSAEKQKQLLTFVICGGGYSGVQLATQLHDFALKSLVRVYKTVNPGNIRVMLIEAASKITGDFDPKLASHAMKHLRKDDIDVRLRSRVTRVYSDRVEINGEEVIPTSMLIWVTGVRANDAITNLEASKDSLGRIMVNNYLGVPGFPGVYAVGDCVHFKDVVSGQPIPPRAHTAVRQARVVAHNVLADLRGRERKPYRYSNNAESLSLGNSDAAVRLFRFRFYGFPARVLWLIGYSFLVTGMYNRARIITDFILSRLFGRDTTLLRLWE